MCINLKGTQTNFGRISSAKFAALLQHMGDEEISELKEYV